MQVPDIHASPDQVEVQYATHVALDDADELVFERFNESFWPLAGYEDHPRDEYTDHDLMGPPTTSDPHQNPVGHGEQHGPCSPLSFGRQCCFQHEHAIPGGQCPDYGVSCTASFATTDQQMDQQAPDAMLEIPFNNAEGIQQMYCPLSLANDGQDVMTGWEDHLVSSADDPHYAPIVGGDARDIGPAPHPTPSGVLSVVRCQHHIQGQPCGVLIEGEISSILEHFACMHVRPRMFANAKSQHPPEFWTCRWGGGCDSRMRKEGIKRHVLGHIFRWKCLTCSSTYSRDDSARKHAKECGDGRISMQPRSEVHPQQL
ncbi:hypothetical protein DEU56DRAFT_781110 [Suillus clintonianus]|uniref:uncharacterized protein n=1 Tax=Suillus clintonianus TaxID=1904413 RepID=UPI001B85D7A4|nr:uncharacterized protein DEU56DRAFT_781110 [Suillus clintonianus]KAG2149178.1 hypothetical protein DEU56DRAFT_781110 [Suillus clintonianus]